MISFLEMQAWRYRKAIRPAKSVSDVRTEGRATIKGRTRLALAVAIGHVAEEAQLAVRIQHLLKNALGRACNIYLCSDRVESVCYPGKCDLFLALCSPFSVKQAVLNFHSGVAYMARRDGKQKRGATIIIPLCHSGQKAAALPQYLASHQALEFGNGFAETLVGIVRDRLEGLTGHKHHRHRHVDVDKVDTDLQKWIENQHKRSTQIFYATCHVGNATYLRFKKGKDGVLHILETLTGINTPDDRQSEAKLRKMNSLLTDGGFTTVDAGLSIGIQNCLGAHDKIYVGARAKAAVRGEKGKVSGAYKALGEFETGYSVIKTSEDFSALVDEGSLSKNNMFCVADKAKSLFVKNGSDIECQMTRRLRVAGRRLWKVQLGDNQYVATVSVSRTRRNGSGWAPRFDVGIWKYINISDFVKDDPYRPIIVPGFGHDRQTARVIGGQKIMHYWIWVRNGEIFFWSFEDEDLIPRYKIATRSNRKSVLVSTRYLLETFGKPERYTPFGSDEDLKLYNVVREPFSQATTTLFSVF